MPDFSHRKDDFDLAGAKKLTFLGGGSDGPARQPQKIVECHSCQARKTLLSAWSEEQIYDVVVWNLSLRKTTDAIASIAGDKRAFVRGPE